MLVLKSISVLALVAYAVDVVAKDPPSYDYGGYVERGGYDYHYPKPKQQTTIRKEWRTMRRRDQQKFIRAIKCMMRKPSQFGSYSEYPGAVNRYDDFTLTHILQTRNIHFNGQFLPWHRYHLLLFDEALRSECRYKGPFPYWDPSRDVPPNGKFLESPIFDSKFGFGGNGEFIPIPEDFTYEGLDMTILPLDGSDDFTDLRGHEIVVARLPSIANARTGGGCVTDGPFRYLEIRLGPSLRTGLNKRCLTRDFAPALAEGAPLIETLEKLQNSATYENVSTLINTPHGVGHASTGGVLGEMFNLFSSVNDPLFWLHHANIDRIWWNWQAADLPSRLFEMDGFAFATGPEQVSLDFHLDLSPVAESLPVRNFMDIRELGYDYDNS